MIPYRRKPSAGFVYLLLVAVATVLFLAWGLARPPLEEAWRLDIELGLGKRPPLSPAEMDGLQAILVAHPEVAEFLSEDKHAGVFSANDDGKIEGEYAYLVRQGPSEPGLLTVTYAGARKKGAISVSARTVLAGANGGVRRFKPWSWRLPDDGPFPQLVEIRLSPATDQKQLHPVRIDLRGAP